MLNPIARGQPRNAEAAEDVNHQSDHSFALKSLQLPFDLVLLACMRPHSSATSLATVVPSLGQVNSGGTRTG
jgi:hypothetical protein